MVKTCVRKLALFEIVSLPPMHMSNKTENLHNGAPLVDKKKKIILYTMHQVLSNHTLKSKGTFGTNVIMT